MARERFFVEVAPGYVRLRHQLGLRTKFGRGRLGPLLDQVVRQLEDLEEAGESIEFNRLDADEESEILAASEAERHWNEELFLDTLDPDEVAHYFESKELEAAREAAQERLGRGAKGMSERSRREMWRWVLSLPFEMLGDRPLWITLTYIRATRGSGSLTVPPWSATGELSARRGTGRSGRGLSGSGPRSSSSQRAARTCIC